MFVSHGEAVYEGMIIGIHSRENDLVVNPIKTKKLTNIRAAGKDDALILTPPIELTLEYAVEFIADDELVEVTPKNIRIRKRKLLEHERKRAIARRRGAAGLIENPATWRGFFWPMCHMRRIGFSTSVMRSAKTGDMTGARRLQGRELRLHSIHPHRGWVHEKDVIEMARHQHRSARNQLRGGGSVQKPAFPVDADSGIATAGL